MSSWLHCEVEAAFFLFLAVFFDFEEETALLSAPVEDAELFGVEVGGLSESRSSCESLSDVPFCSCFTADFDAISFLPLDET